MHGSSPKIAVPLAPEGFGYWARSGVGAVLRVGYEIRVGVGVGSTWGWNLGVGMGLPLGLGLEFGRVLVEGSWGQS